MSDIEKNTVNATVADDAGEEASIPLRCQECGRAARVIILEGYSDGSPRRRRLCLTHAADHAPRVSVVGAVARRPTLPTLFAVAGIIGAAVGMFGDSLSMVAPMTFGWSQGLAIAAGGLIIFVGALLRADFIALAGTLLFIGGLCADWFAAPNAGFGIKQQGILAVSATLLAMPLFARCWRVLLRSGAATPPAG